MDLLLECVNWDVGESWGSIERVIGTNILFSYFFLVVFEGVLVGWVGIDLNGIYVS